MTHVKTVLISGGAGFIGTRLARRLVGGHRVVLLDNLHPQVHKNGAWPTDSPAEAEQRFGDVTEADAWNSAIADYRPNIIVHLAAETGTGQSLTESHRHASVNVTGTARMLDALSHSGHRPEAIVLASSRAVYGEGQWKTVQGDLYYATSRGEQQLAEGKWEPIGPDGEEGQAVAHSAASVEPRPTNVYAATKLAQEHLLSSWCTSMNVPLRILRLQNVYGAGQALENSYTGVLTYFARQAMAGEPINVYEGGDIVRDFVHVDDVVSALSAALALPAEYGFGLVDIGSGSAGTLLEYATILAEVAGSPAPETSERFRLGDVRAAFADIAPARALLGYEPQVSFQDGVVGLLEWARQGAGVSGDPLHALVQSE
ncbi:NAD(P)-dependent oxidoreductase [Cryobacterium sp. Hz9]|uniref:NAD-dependent epimerase/dehydratase family protein n=1 Tax=Cryobacterium sp. Hz9 TaxID=1259167 RepID=UPI00106C5CF9|nr:NAD-dependent epimerase/dehydratase family protein [Cryobacterium sp. Hz9]TFB65711.1 NAD-dependent epimerase/dehydratase family protein [Cryobacterium sp. Hz9]